MTIIFSYDIQYPSLLRRLKESFKGSADLSSGDEDSPCLPVEICDIKHPPPVLPPLPSGLTTNQVCGLDIHHLHKVIYRIC